MTTAVFLAHSAADSGAEQSLVATLQGWPVDGGRPTLVLGDHGPIAERAERAGVRWIVVAVKGRGGDLRRGERGVASIGRAVMSLLRMSSPVRRILVEVGADVVVAVSIKSLFYGLLAGRRAGVTVVWSLHDRVSSDYFPRFLVLVARLVLPRLVDGLVVNSRSTLATVNAGRTPVLVSAPNIRLDPRTFSPPGATVRRVVMLGRLAPWKGQDNFLRAFAASFRGTSTCAAVVGGALFGETAYEQHLKRLARELGIEDQVRFTGHVEDPWAQLVDADVLAHCSRTPEPFGQVVVQGMWSRCAVVATRPGGPEEVITHGVDGLLVPCDDVAALTSAFTDLRDDAPLRSRLAHQARLTAARYDGAAAGEQVHAWLTQLVGRELPRGSVRQREHSG